MRIVALTKRIVEQIIHDKRTMLLIVLAPLFIITVIYFILNSEDNHCTIGIIAASEEFKQGLKGNEDFDIILHKVTLTEAKQKIKNQEIDAAVQIDDKGNAIIYLGGADTVVASKAQMVIKSANTVVLKQELEQKLKRTSILGISLKDPEYVTHYVTGSEDGNLFEKFGTQLIGIIVYFFVFLIAGINFLNERTTGTMEKLLSTPIRRYEIVSGYLIGFGLMAVLQSLLVTMFVVYVLGITVQGSIFLVLLIILLTAINALCLGILLSTLANSEFQMVQFIPIVILPQIFLAGLFRISGIWEKLGCLFPLHYTAHALTCIMINGNGVSVIWIDLVVLSGISALFIWINILLLKKQRNI